MIKLDLNLPVFISADNQRIENIMPANNRHFSLYELYKLIECELVQVVELYDETIMIIDEEGKLKVNPVINKLASQLYSVDRMNETEFKDWMRNIKSVGFTIIGLSGSDLGLPHNSICGNVIICQNKFFQ
jgi:hypothetical protein